MNSPDGGAHPVAPAARAETPAGGSFDPRGFQAFRFVDVEFDPGTSTAVLRYALDDVVPFEERIGFPGIDAPAVDPGDERLHRALRLLHLLAGVSYFKTALPAELRVETGPVSVRMASFLTEVYRHGLGEFAYENKIDLRDRSWFTGEGEPAPPPAPALPRRTAVPVGGGKDSIVTIETLRAIGEPVVLFSVGRTGPIAGTIETAGLPAIDAERTLSPNLTELNAAGAYNGHVPVTAIVSVIAVVGALLHGYDAIAMSNERSASVGSLEWNGQDVNHQWSKGLGFEDGLRDLIAREVAPGLDYFSALRPQSELAIARAFAKLERYHPVFTSCNAVFRRDPARRASSWCGECPKCRFVFLILAPFMSPPALKDIFGRDLLDDADQLPGFRALLGWEDDKPFECVGEVEESLAAFRLLAEREEWSGHEIVAAVVREYLPARPGFGDPEQVLKPSAEHNIPSRLAAEIDAHL